MVRFIFTRHDYITAEFQPQPTPPTAPPGTEVYYADKQHNGAAASIALCFTGKQNKPALYINFRSSKLRDQGVAQWLISITAVAAAKQERRNARKTADCPYQVGDILHGSWGYDQTQCEYYQIVALSGRRAELREIAADVVPNSSGGMSEYLTPKPGHFTNEAPITRIAQTYDGQHWYFKLHNSCSLDRWEGGSNYHSWYG